MNELVERFLMCQRVTKTTVDGWVREYTIESFLVRQTDVDTFGEDAVDLLRGTGQWKKPTNPDRDRDELAKKIAQRLFSKLKKGKIESIASPIFHKAQAGNEDVVAAGIFSDLKPNQVITGCFTVIA